MTFIRRVLQGLLTLGILTMLVYFLISGPPAIIGKPVEQEALVADNYLVSAQSWEYTDTGQRSFLLAVENMEHFDHTGTSTITNPTLDVYSEGKPDWEVSAASGRIVDGNSRIELRTDVKLTSLNSDLLLTTTAMDIYPARKLAKSNKPVQVSDGLSSLRAGAMTVDMNSRMITMRKRVTGNHSAQ